MLTDSVTIGAVNLRVTHALHFLSGAEHQLQLAIQLAASLSSTAYTYDSALNYYTMGPIIGIIVRWGPWEETHRCDE